MALLVDNCDDQVNIHAASQGVLRSHAARLGMHLVRLLGACTSTC